jgi:hypothetical protein
MVPFRDSQNARGEIVNSLGQYEVILSETCFGAGRCEWSRANDRGNRDIPMTTTILVALVVAVVDGGMVSCREVRTVRSRVSVCERCGVIGSLQTRGVIVGFEVNPTRIAAERAAPAVIRAARADNSADVSTVGREPHSGRELLRATRALTTVATALHNGGGLRQSVRLAKRDVRACEPCELSAL